MSDSYSGEKILQRQRICNKCNSFVTHEKINEKQFACPLCSNRINITVSFEGKISYEVIAKLVATQAEAKKKAT